MSETFNLIDKTRSFFKFTSREIKGLIAVILVTAFIISFDNWGEGTLFDTSVGIANLIVALLVTAITVLVAQSAHRLLGLRFGYRIEFKPWYMGLIIGLIMAFVTRGKIWFILPGGFFLHHMAMHRLGSFRYGTNTVAMAFVGFAGPLANIILATAIKTAEVWFNVPIADIPFLNQLFFFNWAYALFNLIPIPPLPGSYILFQSRLFYAFIFGSVAGYFALVTLGIYSFVYAILIGIVVWGIYYFFVERSWWAG